RFGNIYDDTHLGEWLDEVARRAAAQNEQYLEIMQTPDSEEAIRLGRELGWNGNPAAMRKVLLERGLRRNVETDRRQLEVAERDRQRLERCSEKDPDRACAVRIR